MTNPPYTRFDHSSERGGRELTMAKMPKKPDYGDAKPEDMARALLKPNIEARARKRPKQDEKRGGKG